MPIKKEGDWVLAQELTLGAVSQFLPTADKVLKRYAVKAQNEVKKSIGKNAAPLSPLTMATGGKGKPLRRGGDLKASPTVIAKAMAEYFIGIPRGDGSFNIAVIHEEGVTVVQPLTPRMRRFLHAKLGDATEAGGRDSAGRFTRTKTTGGKGASKAVLITTIPPRPFIEAAFNKVQLDMAANFPRDFAKAMGDRYGTA